MGEEDKCQCEHNEYIEYTEYKKTAGDNKQNDDNE